MTNTEKFPSKRLPAYLHKNKNKNEMKLNAMAYLKDNTADSVKKKKIKQPHHLTCYSNKHTLMTPHTNVQYVQ